METLRTIRISPYTLLRKERRLPLPGEIIVRPGTYVEASQTVAKAQVFDWICLNVAEELGIPEENLTQFLAHKVGEWVEEGQDIAVKKGVLPFTSISYASPVTGYIAAAEMGQVIIRATASELELKAGVRGSVVGLIPSFGVLIEGKGALAEAIWLNGREGTGVIQMIGTSGDYILERGDLEKAGHKGFVLVTGCVEDVSVLEKVRESEAAGLIVGGLNPGLYSVARDMPYPILVTDGFGERVPMSPLIFELLQSAEGQEVSILKPDALNARPCAFVPLPTETVSADRRPAVLAPGTRVRICRAPHRGRCGEIVSLPEYEITLESNYTVSLALVRLTTGEEVEVPLANLELIDES